MSKKPSASWIAVDWGTSNLRVWIMDESSAAVAKVQSTNGMGVLAPEQFEDALLALIDPYLTHGTITPVICAGMVGARQGWVEAPYVATPCTPPNRAAATLVPTKDPRVSVHILPGVKQMSPPDVMRGEETQIAGVVKQHPNFDGILCLPGTHTKWVHISAGEIVSFQTFMTGEMFALLGGQSVLRHSVTTDDWDQDSFITAAADGMARPQAIAANLFGIRAAGLVSQQDAKTARARLSGLLIGAELVAARAYWLGQNVAIVGDDNIGDLYRAALAEQGVTAAVWDVSDLTLSGLIGAYDTQQEATK